ncbi:MAG: hypothetical protein HC880_03785 [Bacteroidia bacterium]|nr:hypothetical protein [Bacteroidia bacterium]
MMGLQNARYVTDGKVMPLIKGKIQLQREAAEVYYKDIMIISLDALPKKYAAYFVLPNSTN